MFRFVFRLNPVIVLFVAGLFICYKYFLQIFPTVIIRPLMATFDLSGAAFGYLGGVFFSSYLLMQLVAGPLLDRYDARKVLSLAVLVCSLASFCFAYGDGFFLLVISRALMGAGVAFATVGYMKLCAQYFPSKHFALASGLLTVGVMVGALFAQAPLAYLVDCVGWQLALWITGLVGLALSCSFLLLLLLPLHSYDIVQDQAMREKSSVTIKSYWFLLKQPRCWYLLSYSGLAFAPLAVFGGLWGTPFISEAYQLPVLNASALVSCVYIGFGVGGPFCGYISDRLSNRLRVMRLGCFISFISLFFIIYITLWPAWFLVVLMLLFGLSTGAFMLGFVAAKESQPIALAACVIALINSGDAFYNTITEPLIGYFLDLLWDGQWLDGARYFSVANFQISFILFFIYIILAFIFLSLFARTSKHHTV